MTRLLIAAAVFLATHCVTSTPLRARLVRLLGANGYLLLYSAIAFATLAGMVWAYYRAPFIGLWHVPALRYAPLLVMPVAMVLLTCGLLTRNPTLVGAERLLRGAEPARGILRVTRHPVMWGIALWAASHIAARGDAAAIVFFGSMLALALTGTVLIDRRKRAVLGPEWTRYEAATSNVPLAAIVTGANRFSTHEIGWMRLVVGLSLYALVLWAHPTLFGSPPY
ncbi:MAG TPA: NnrU family protein [Burkholderiales bacterium]|nr:NnrU family protein [Burkholderiales bacterium]